MAETDSYDYDLPADRIAERPVEPRDAARLLVLARETGAIEDRVFRDLPDLLRPGDLLVVNDTRVIPARLFGRRADTGGAVEVFLLRAVGGGRWAVLMNPAKRMRPGTSVVLEGGASCAVETVEEGVERTVVFRTPDGHESADVLALAERSGATPLPPYIRRDADDRDRSDYQTVYADSPGAVAAPTAGLHFTSALLDRLVSRGIEVARVTLHVGPGTFRLLSSDDLDAHRMDSERYAVPAATEDAIAATKARQGRVVAVGTTVVRTLESVADDEGRVRARAGETSLFVRPGHRFRVVDALITNFHLPRSTLLVLVAAFTGRDRALAAYRHALESGYRFASYGDAMLIA